MIPSNIAPWFDRLNNIIRQYNLTSSRIYNMDETGFQEGESSIKKVAGSKAIKGAQQGSSTNTTWISIIEYIRADGINLCPTIIFKGQCPQSNWVPTERPLPQWNYQATLSGWTNSYIALLWLKNYFLNETRPADPS